MAVRIEHDGLVKGGQTVHRLQSAGVAVAGHRVGPQPGVRGQGCLLYTSTFTCAHGLYDYGNVASAEDMAKIAAACAANETFAQVAGSTTYTLGQTNFHSEQRTISSSNPLMDASGAYRCV